MKQVVNVNDLTSDSINWKKWLDYDLKNQVKQKFIKDLTILTGFVALALIFSFILDDLFQSRLFNTMVLLTPLILLSAFVGKYFRLRSFNSDYTIVYIMYWLNNLLKGKHIDLTVKVDDVFALDQSYVKNLTEQNLIILLSVIGGDVLDLKDLSGYKKIQSADDPQTIINALYESKICIKNPVKVILRAKGEKA